MSRHRGPHPGQECQGLELPGDGGGGDEGVAVLLYLPRGERYPILSSADIFVYFCDLYLQKIQLISRSHFNKTYVSSCSSNENKSNHIVTAGCIVQLRLMLIMLHFLVNGATVHLIVDIVEERQLVEIQNNQGDHVDMTVYLTLAKE